jgi:hypothetical protein
MKKSLLLAAIAWTVAAAPTAWGQKGIELTPFVGGQFNGGLDLSTTLYKNIDVKNGLNYGFSAGYLSVSAAASNLHGAATMPTLWSSPQSTAPA